MWESRLSLQIVSLLSDWSECHISRAYIRNQIDPLLQRSFRLKVTISAFFERLI
jgi:hypothetical protein